MKNNITLFKSIFIIALTLSIFGFALTQSLFRDRETSETGTFLVGTLDMEVGGANGTAAEQLVVSDFGKSGVIKGAKTWKITNVGTLPGELEFAIENITDTENGCNEPEALIDSSCDNPGEGSGELGAKIATAVKLTQDTKTTQVVTSTLSPLVLQSYAEQWLANAGKVIVPPGETVSVTLEWSAEDSEFSNEVQSDKVSFDLIFQLSQVQNS